MRAKIGLWIDQRKAIIVTITGKGEATNLILSKAEKHLERAGDSPLKGAYEAQKVPPDDSQQHEYSGQLKIFYDAVLACLRDAEAILIFGPGEAKGELKKLLVKSKLGECIAGVETIDKMTGPEIAAKVRKQFPG